MEIAKVTEKPCTKCGLVKSLSEFYKNASKKYGVLPHCKKCHDVMVLAWQTKNPDTYHSYQKEKKSLRTADTKAKRRASNARWKKENASKDLSYVRNRHASKLKATPAWAGQKAIQQYYLIASFLSHELGVKFHVDHIVPLRNELVQGFHSQHNLNIALGTWNLAKSNCWWPDMPDAERLPLAA